MKKLTCFFLLYLIAWDAKSQNISTFAGNGAVASSSYKKSAAFVQPPAPSNQCDYWTQKSGLTAYSGRNNATGFSIGHYGFIGTGGTSSGLVNDFWRWNQDSNTWTAVANYPGMGRLAMTSFTIGGKGYTCFGWTGNGLANDLWEYDTTSNTWTQKASFPGKARYGSFVFIIGTKAYIGCGEPNGMPYFQDVWVYDAIADTWTQVANFPGGLRAGLCAFTQNGYGYAGCGDDDITSYNDLWKYDPKTNTWTSEAPLPVSGNQIAGPVSFVIDSLAYVGVGGTLTGKYYRDFWSYSAATNTWTPVATLTGVARHRSVGFSIGNKGYVGTGDDSASNYLSDYWEYTPCGTSSVGIDNIEAANGQITVYPNPNNGKFIIQSVVPQNFVSTLKVYNMLGEQVYSSFMVHSSSFMVDLNQPNGIYFYRLTKEDGGLIGEGKIVIEK